MTRRALILALGAAAGLRADAATEAWNLLADAARALTEANAAAFFACFDPAMPDYETLRANVQALLAVYEPRSSIELASNEGDDSRRSIAVQWILTLVERYNAISSTERRARVTLRLERKGKKWRIVAFEPVALFAPRRAG